MNCLKNSVMACCKLALSFVAEALNISEQNFAAELSVHCNYYLNFGSKAYCIVVIVDSNYYYRNDFAAIDCEIDFRSYCYSDKLVFESKNFVEHHYLNPTENCIRCCKKFASEFFAVAFVLGVSPWELNYFVVVVLCI